MFIMYLHDVVMHTQGKTDFKKMKMPTKVYCRRLEDYTDESLSFSPHLNRWQVYVNSIILFCYVHRGNKTLLNTPPPPVTYTEPA